MDHESVPINNIDAFEGLIKMQEDIRIEMLDTQDFVRIISNIYKLLGASAHKIHSL